MVLCKIILCVCVCVRCLAQHNKRNVKQCKNKKYSKLQLHNPPLLPNTIESFLLL